MAKKPIPETTDAESIVDEATAIERQIVEAEAELESRKESQREQKQVVDQLYQRLRGLFADEDRPLFDAAEEDA